MLWPGEGKYSLGYLSIISKSIIRVKKKEAGCDHHGGSVILWGLASANLQTECY